MSSKFDGTRRFCGIQRNNGGQMKDICQITSWSIRLILVATTERNIRAMRIYMATIFRIAT